MLKRVLRGDARSAARMLSLVENREAPLEILAQLHRRSGRAHIVGITGAPGAGKSTLVDQLIQAWRKRGKKVGVIAVDPSSPFTGGAILGDRIRMTSRADDPDVFVRSMGSRGSLGGLAATTQDAVKVLDAMGKDIVVIETVGVGQGEVDVVRVADTVAVVLVPGMGDEVQTFKAGIMEIGDVFCVNKADRDGADRTVAELKALLETGEHDASTWLPPILKAIGQTGDGVPELVDAFDRHLNHLKAKGQLAERRRRRSERELLEVLKDRLIRFVVSEDGMHGRFDQYVDRIAEHELSPHEAAAEILRDVA